MADVESARSAPENLGTMGDKQESQNSDTPADAAEEQTTGNDVTENKTEENDVTGDKTEVNEGADVKNESDASATQRRESPEGANNPAADETKSENAPNADTNNAEEQAASKEAADQAEADTREPKTKQEPEGVERARSAAADSQAVTTARTETTNGLQLGDSARQIEGEEEPVTEDGAEKTAENGARLAEGDAAEPDNAREEGQQPPATPTFSEDEGEGEWKGGQERENPPGSESAPPQEQVEGEAAADGDSARSPLTAAAAAQLAKRLTNTPADGNLPKPQTAHLPAIARGQVRGQQMTSAIADAVRNEALPPPRQPVRTRRPPKYIRLATVTVSPARTRPLPHGPSLYYEEPKRPKKVITWDEATNARPPLRIDMEGPTPCSYTPRVKPLNETNAPSYTFGSRCLPEKEGGSRTSWSKSWFQTPHVWHHKVDFTRDGQWPSPHHYPKQSSLGPRQRTMPEAPSYTFGHRMAYSIVKPGAPKEPSPNEYRRQTADKVVLPRGPAFTHQLRREGTTLWGSYEHTPGPAAYSPHKPSRERPSFTIQGIRREKSHILGPYSAL